MYKRNKKYNTLGNQAQLSPLQVVVRGNTKEDFELAFRVFKKTVQSEKIISLYKEKRAYEKPSDKKRRKRKEARERRLALAAKQRLIASGEWEKRMRKKQEKRQQRQQMRQKSKEENL